jgi:hypothetical protein
MVDAKINFSDSVADFLNYILDDSDASATVLIVCSTRDFFLEQLSACTRNSHEHGPNLDLMSQPTQRTRSLLARTIGLIAQSQSVKLVFCPTVAHLRAYLSVLLTNMQQWTKIDNSRHCQKVLAILNLVALHWNTVEFSAQGLSRTLASAVEAASKQDASLVLSECVHTTDASWLEHGEGLWNMHVPLLSDALRIGDDGRSTWTGRGISIERIVQRWFRFDREDAATARLAG